MNKKLIALILLALQGSIVLAETVVYADNNSDACCVTRPVCCPRPSRRVNCCPRKYRGRRWRNCCPRRPFRRARRFVSNCCPRPSRRRNCCTTWNSRWNDNGPRRRPACCPRPRYCRPKPACCPTNGTATYSNGDTVMEPVEAAVEGAETVAEDAENAVEVAV